MARTNSPLRYPGGKSCLFGLTVDVLQINGLERGHYAEPYAGGFGLALSLLYGGHVADVHLNDIDKSIWAFWHCVLNQTFDLIEKIKNTPVTIDQWIKQRDIYRSIGEVSTLDLGFATFFLNRTNRSGIIKGGGLIGGLEQKGLYKMDCRYNIEDLVMRVKRVKKYSERIHLTNLDALDFMEDLDKALPKKSLWFIDPPYYAKGAELYTSFYDKKDHLDVATTVSNLSKNAIVTYDNTPEIRHLYKGQRQFVFDISYSLAEKKRGTELFIASRDLIVPAAICEKQINC